MGALVALAAVAWSHPSWRSIEATGDEAVAALDGLGLAQFAGWRPAVGLTPTDVARTPGSEQFSEFEQVAEARVECEPPG